MNVSAVPHLHRSVLIAIYRIFEETLDCNGKFDEGQIRLLPKFGINTGIARASLQGLVDSNLLVRNKIDEKTGQNATWEFTPKGAEFVYAMVRDYDEAEVSVAKAIDGTVLDNFRSVDQSSHNIFHIKQVTDGFISLITKDGEAKGNLYEHKAALAEIQAFQAMLNGSYARTVFVLQAVSNTGAFRCVQHLMPEKNLSKIVDGLRGAVISWLEI